MTEKSEEISKGDIPNNNLENAVVPVISPVIAEYPCSICGKPFKSEKSMQMHKLRAHRVKPGTEDEGRAGSAGSVKDDEELSEAAEFRRERIKESEHRKLYDERKKKLASMLKYKDLYEELADELGVKLPTQSQQSNDPVMQDPIVRIKYAKVLDAMAESERTRAQPQPRSNPQDDRVTRLEDQLREERGKREEWMLNRIEALENRPDPPSTNELVEVVRSAERVVTSVREDFKPIRNFIFYGGPSGPLPERKHSPEVKEGRKRILTELEKYKLVEKPAVTKKIQKVVLRDIA